MVNHRKTCCDDLTRIVYLEDECRWNFYFIIGLHMSLKFSFQNLDQVVSDIPLVFQP